MRLSLKIVAVCSLLVLVWAGWGLWFTTDRYSSAAGNGKIRTYFIAADEVVWDYAPARKNQITGQVFDSEAQVFVESGSDRIGSRYQKARYREYTDSTFSKLKFIPEQWQHLGLLGPVIRAEVGDTIRVEFKNNTSYPASIHPHGVFYQKDSEGAPYSDGTAISQHRDDAVPPGGSYTYTWLVPERAGPGPHDASSILWMYHSHTHEVSDTNTGLIGPLVITAKDKAKPDGSPKDIDREFVTLLSVIDENQSWYLSQNIQTYAGEPAKVDPEDDEFQESNLMHSINGYVYGNLPLLSMKKEENVRWYLLDMGTEVDLHTPHWHGNTGLMMGMRMDMVDLLPGDMKVIDFKPDAVGTWLFHCHVNDHIVAGMEGRYQVLP